MRILEYAIILFVFSLLYSISTIAKEQNDKYAQISSRLGFNIEKLLRDSLHYENPDFKSRTRLFWQRTNFSSTKRTKEDYLLKANIKADWWKQNTTLIIAFVKKENIYKPVFYWEGSNKSFDAIPSLLDIDSDSRMEILIEEDGSGNQSTATEVNIWRFNGERFISIFSQSLCEGYLSCPYSIDNKYVFVKNPKNAKLLDIYFTVETDTSTESSSIFDHQFTDQEKQAWPKPFQCVYIFQFDGIEYIPNKSVYEYRKFFEKFFNEREIKNR